MRRLFAILVAAIATIILVGCSTTAPTQPTSNDDVDAGYVSGDGSVRQWEPDERGDPVELAGVSMEDEDLDITQWRGDVVVLNFWYAECPPCRKEAPDLVALAEEFDQQAHFMGVNHINEPETALAFQRRFEIPYPTLYDKDAAGVAALQSYVALQAMPSTVVLDQQGRVAARILGLVDKSTLKALIDDTLAEEG